MVLLLPQRRRTTPVCCMKVKLGSVRGLLPLIGTCGRNSAPTDAAIPPSAIGRYDEAWKRLLLQDIPAEVIVQSAAKDLRTIIIGRAAGRKVGAALGRFAKIGIEVFKAERPLLARGIFDAAANCPSSPRCHPGKACTYLVTGTVGEAAGAIEQPFVSRDASARAQRADPALLVTEAREVEPIRTDEIGAALATDVTLDTKDERASLRIVAKPGAISGATAVCPRPIERSCLGRRRRRSFSAGCHLDRTHGRGERRRGNASKQQFLHRLHPLPAWRS